jgi:transcriptional regulator with XRE-family HTH domain
MATNLAEKIDYLFRTHPSPRGREYSYREVAAAMSRPGTADGAVPVISAGYLWGLRTGVKDNPTLRHLEGLARFFDVAPSYFFDEELSAFPETDVRLLAASSKAVLRRVAVTLLGLSEESLNAVLAVASQLRRLEGFTVPEDTTLGEQPVASRATHQRPPARAARLTAALDQTAGPL